MFYGAGIFATFLNDIDSALLHYVRDTFGALTAITQPLFTSMFVLFILLYGISIWFQYVNVSVGETIKHLFKALIIWTLLTKYSPAFLTYFVLPLQFSADQIAGALLTKTSASSFNGAIGLMDVIWDKFEVVAEKASTAASTGTGWMFSLIIYISAFLTISFAVIQIALSRLALTLLLGLAPIFIITFMFKGTSKFFEAWLQKCIEYALIPMLVYASALIPIAIIDLKITAALANNQFSLGTIFFVFSISVLSFLLLLQALQIAASLSGGVALSTLGVVGAFDRGQSRARGANRRFWDKSKTNKSGFGQRRGDKWKQSAGNFKNKAWSAVTNRTGRIKRTG